MTEKPKSKRAAALERIRELAAQRGAAKGGGGGPKTGSGGPTPKQAPKHGGVGHRPQGG